MVKDIEDNTGYFLGRFVAYLIRYRTKKNCINFFYKKIDTIEILPYIEKNKRYTTSEIVEEIFKAVTRFR